MTGSPKYTGLIVFCSFFAISLQCIFTQFIFDGTYICEQSFLGDIAIPNAYDMISFNEDGTFDYCVWSFECDSCGSGEYKYDGKSSLILLFNKKYYETHNFINDLVELDSSAADGDTLLLSIKVMEKNILFSDSVTSVTGCIVKVKDIENKVLASGITDSGGRLNLRIYTPDKIVLIKASLIGYVTIEEKLFVHTYNKNIQINLPYVRIVEGNFLGNAEGFMLKHSGKNGFILSGDGGLSWKHFRKKD